jgi:hypothetical protein
MFSGAQYFNASIIMLLKRIVIILKETNIPGQHIHEECKGKHTVQEKLKKV